MRRVRPDLQAPRGQIFNLTRPNNSTHLIENMEIDGLPQGLFFAGSDDEDDLLIEEAREAQLEASGSKPRLFFADSEDEDDTHASSFATPMKRSIPIHGQNEDMSSDIEIPSFEDVPRASSVTSVSSGRSQKDRESSPVPSIESIERPTKKRRVSTIRPSSQAPF